MKRILVVLLLIVTSCKSSKEMASTSTSTVKDSISTVVSIVPHDTIIKVAAESAQIRVPISELSEKPILKTAGKITASVKKVDNTVEVDCHTEEYELKIALLNKIISTYKQQVKETKSVEKVPVKYIPKVVKLLAWCGAFFLVVIIAGVVPRIKKII